MHVEVAEVVIKKGWLESPIDIIKSSKNGTQMELHLGISF